MRNATAEPRDPYMLGSLRKGLEVIDCFARQETWSLAELAGTLQQSKPTIFRILHTLEARDTSRRTNGPDATRWVRAFGRLARPRRGTSSCAGNRWRRCRTWRRRPAKPPMSPSSTAARRSAFRSPRGRGLCACAPPWASAPRPMPARWARSCWRRCRTNRWRRSLAVARSRASLPARSVIPRAWRRS